MTDGANINVGVSGETGATVSPDERERRQRVLKKAIASYNDQKITMECIVRDLSSSGVKLKLSNPLPLPDHFLFEFCSHLLKNLHPETNAIDFQHSNEIADAWQSCELLEADC